MVKQPIKEDYLLSSYLEKTNEGWRITFHQKKTKGLQYLDISEHARGCLGETKAPDETMEQIAEKAFDLFIDVAFINKNKPVEQIVEGHLSDRYSINGMIMGGKKTEIH